MNALFLRQNPHMMQRQVHELVMKRLTKRHVVMNSEKFFLSSLNVFTGNLTKATTFKGLIFKRILCDLTIFSQA